MGIIRVPTWMREHNLMRTRQREGNSQVFLMASDGLSGSKRRKGTSGEPLPGGGEAVEERADADFDRRVEARVEARVEVMVEEILCRQASARPTSSAPGGSSTSGAIEKLASETAQKTGCSSGTSGTTAGMLDLLLRAVGGS